METYHRFSTAIDWDAYPKGLVARWYQQSLIFVAPLYMIRYGIAEFGALQIWRDSLSDPRSSVDRLRDAMALGNTLLLPDLYAAAGIPVELTTEHVADLVAFVESRLALLEAPAWPLVLYLLPLSVEDVRDEHHRPRRSSRIGLAQE